MRRSGLSSRRALAGVPVAKLAKDLLKYMPSTPALPSDGSAADDADDLEAES